VLSCCSSHHIIVHIDCLAAGCNTDFPGVSRRVRWFHQTLHASAETCKRACRRQMFANHKLAFAAAEMEVHEAKGRLAAQNQLAAAEAQVRRPYSENIRNSVCSRS